MAFLQTTAASISSGGTINGDLTISGDLTVEGGGVLAYDETVTGDLFIDKNFTGTTSATTRGLYVDFDATGITASGQTAANIGLDLDMNSEVPTMVGTVNNVGIDLDVVGGTSGTTKNIGIDVSVSGATTNYAALFNGGNVGIGVDAPYNLLHIRKSAVTNSDSHDDDLLVIEENGDHCNINMISDTGSYLMWSDATRNAANINYQHSSGAMGFTSETTEEFVVASGTRFKLDANSRISLSNNDSSGAVGTTLLGYNAGLNIVSGQIENTFIGHAVADATGMTNAADYNTGVGAYALSALTAGHRNTAIGAYALGTNSSGIYNTAVGTDALGTNSTTHNNTAVGQQSGAYTTGADNTYVGFKSGFGASGAEAYNVGLGSSALVAVVAGSSNSVVGESAGAAITAGGDNVIMGRHAGVTLSTSGSNTLIGRSAGFTIAAGQTTTDGTVAVGSNALYALTSGAGNVAVGYQAGNILTSGSNNTVLGYDADTDDATATNQIVIGNSEVGYADNFASIGGTVLGLNVPNTMSSPYYRFDGVNDEIAVADSPHLSFGRTTSDTAFSISAWINMEDATSFPIANKGTFWNADAEWVMEVTSADKLRLMLLDDSISVCSEIAETTAVVTAYEGKWTHVCATYNGVGGASANAGITIYINGVSQALSLSDNTGGGAYEAMENQGIEVRIGNYNDATYARGSIAGLKMWNIALTATEVKEDYSGASVPFKYKGANQTELLASGTCTNRGGSYGYDTFDNASQTGFRAIKTNTTYSANGGTGDVISFLKGKAYRVSFHATLTSGVVPQINIRDSTGSGGSSVESDDGNTIVAGDNSMVFTCTLTMTGVVDFLTAASLVTNFTIAELSVSLAGAVAEYDGSSSGVAKWYDNSGNGLDGTVTGATLENANAVGVQRIDDSSGAVTMPEQPAFLVKPSTNQLNLTVTDGSLLIAFATEIFDVGSNFASSTFTAPVTGKYQFSSQILLLNIDPADAYVGCQLTTSNRNYSGSIIDPDAFDSAPVYWTLNVSILADMDAGDTALFRWRQAGGTAVTDISSDSYFSGYLVC